MKLSISLTYSGNPVEEADKLVALEKAGLDRVWLAEAYSFDAPSLMGYIAARTERIELAYGILNIYSRTPGLLAMSAAGLDNVSGGRAILGLGASGPQVIEGYHGVPYEKPIARTSEIIDIIRMALRREPLQSDGLIKLPLTKEHGAVTGLGKPLKLLNRDVRADIPIWLAALGAKNVELAAEKADGWLPIFFAPERARETWGDAIAQGTANRSADLGPLEIAAGGMLAIGEGEETKALLDFARPTFALYIGGMGARGKNFYNTLVSNYGFEAEAKKIQDLYLEGRKDEAAAAVPLELLEMTNLVGPASYVKERIEAYREAGVTDLQIVPAAADNAALVSQVKELIG